MVHLELTYYCTVTILQLKIFFKVSGVTWY